MNDISFTPLDTNKHIGKKPHGFFRYLAINIGFIVTGLFVVFNVFIVRQTMLSKTITSKASEGEGICFPLTPHNPSEIKAKIGNLDVSWGEKITSDSITFEWNSIPSAKFYYVALETTNPLKLSGRADPALVGTASANTKYTFKDLKPNVQYYFYVRSRSKDGHLGFIFPTPGNCNYGISALPTFEFSTK